MSTNNPRVSVIIPLFNDERNVAEIGAKVSGFLRTLAMSYELILVDDGSPDGTEAALATLAEQHDDILVLAMERNVGQARAVVAALELARGEVVVTMDSDLETGLAIIPRLVSAIAAGAELACGRRSGRKPLFHRRLGSSLVNGLVYLLFRARVADIGCGTNAGSRALLNRWLGDPYGAQFIKLALLQMARRIVEVDVDLRAIPDEERLVHRTEAPMPSKYRLWGLLRQVFGLLWFRIHPRRPQRPASVRRLAEAVGSSGAPLKAPL